MMELGWTLWWLVEVKMVLDWGGPFWWLAEVNGVGLGGPLVIGRGEDGFGWGRAFLAVG